MATTVRGQSGRKDILAKRLHLAAQYRAHKWGYQFQPALETQLAAKIQEGIDKIEGRHGLNDEFPIARFEANLSVLVDQMVAKREESVLGKRSPKLLNDSLVKFRCAFFPFD